MTDGHSTKPGGAAGAVAEALVGAGVSAVTAGRVARQPSHRSVTAAFQQMLLKPPGPGLTLTEGAATLLATAATEQVFRQDASKAARLKAIGEAGGTVGTLLATLGEKLAEIGPGEAARPARADKRQVAALKAKHAFCGIAPWC
jgi:hypothetical protein